MGQARDRRKREERKRGAGRRREEAQLDVRRREVPDGFVDIGGACAMLKASLSALTEWQRQGKIAFARWGRTPENKRYRLFAVADLERFIEHKRAETVFVEPGAPGTYHVPEGYVRARQAAGMFGVSYKTLRRWEAEGRITSGTTGLGAKLKVYRVDELRRLVAECGTMSPPYEDPERPGVWRVPLAGHGIQRKEALIDAADLPLVEGNRCHFTAQGPKHESDTVVVVVGGAWRNLRALVMGVNGPGLRVSHRNGDALDCRRANLIVRTPQALSRGYGKQTAYGGRPCSSRFKGVCWDKQTGKWRASIVLDGRTIQLGRHHDEVAAAEAYDEAAKELFGEQARLNFPDGIDAYLEREVRERETQLAA
jgi:DNA-binding transcriptional MerR regulator